MKKHLLTFLLSAFTFVNLFGQACPDCNTVSFTSHNATGYGCNGELFVTFNGACPTQIQVIGTQYNGTPYNNINSMVTPPYGHWNLKAGTYSFQLTSYDGLTLQCSTAFFPFTITQPICDYDLHYLLGAPDYCLELIPVSIWSTNQGCTNTENAILNQMVINGFTSFNNQPITFDMLLNTTDSFTVYNYDFINGSLQAICSEKITITTPGCTFGLSLSSTIGTKCDNHKITATASGGLCGGQWGADLYKNSVYDTTIYSGTNQIQFTNLSNGSYNVVATSAACSDSKTITLNYCPKPYGTTVTEITASGGKLKWTKQTCAVGYQALYRVQGTTTWTTKNVNNNTPSKVLTGLAPSTVYEWKVRTKCQNSPVLYSNYTTLKTFTTLALRESNLANNFNAGLNEVTNLSLTPNPAQKSLTIFFDCNTPSVEMEVINITGQVVLKKTISVNENRIAYTIDVEKFVSGVYVVRIKTENGFATKRFVKE